MTPGWPLSTVFPGNLRRDFKRIAKEVAARVGESPNMYGKRICCTWQESVLLESKGNKKYGSIFSLSTFSRIKIKLSMARDVICGNSDLGNMRRPNVTQKRMPCFSTVSLSLNF